jgi:hypothetical protein
MFLPFSYLWLFYRKYTEENFALPSLLGAGGALVALMLAI